MHYLHLLLTFVSGQVILHFDIIHNTSLFVSCFCIHIYWIGKVYQIHYCFILKSFDLETWDGNYFVRSQNSSLYHIKVGIRCIYRLKLEKYELFMININFNINDDQRLNRKMFSTVFTLRCSPFADMRSDIFSDLVFVSLVALVEVVVPSPATTVRVMIAACEL